MTTSDPDREYLSSSGLRRLRAAAGLTQRELAKRAGISAAYLSLLESGRRRPSARTARSLVRVLERRGHRTLGEFVKSRRRVNGLTQRELAELAGVGVRLVSELERDKPTIRLDAANRVLAVFGKCVGVVERRRDEAES